MEWLNSLPVLTKLLIMIGGVVLTVLVLTVGKQRR